MARGPKPQPASVREQKEPVRSTHQPRPSYAEASASAVSVIPPKWLKKEGLRIWNQMAPTLQALKLLTAADVAAFARYCRNYARWLDAERVIDKEGATYESESQWGKLKRINPVFMIADRLERQLLAAEDRFGLNPAERQRIFAARAAGGGAGDLFTPKAAPGPSTKRPDDPAAAPIAPAEPIEAPEGFLN